MNNLKVLHVTYWYPNKDNHIEGIFIKEHIDTLKKQCENTVVHIQFKNDDSCIFRVIKNKLPDGTEQILIYSFIKIWFIIELISSLFFIFIIIKYKLNIRFNLLNVHIAYPLLTYLHFFNFLIKVPLIVTEHWSAYHLNFGLPTDSKKLDKIKRIFYNRFILITVSEALANDIILFSGNKYIIYKVVPNVVNVKNLNTTFEKKDVSSKLSFFSLAFWREIKNPFLLLESFKQVCLNNPKSILRIGGDGPLISEMKERVANLDLQGNVNFLGPLTKNQVFFEMRKSTAFLHTSYFETFSVVCVEALCCGTPVIANNIPAIAEYVDECNGILVPSNTIDDWANALTQFIVKYKYYDNHKIAAKAINKFSSTAVSKKYYQIIKETIANYKNP